MFEDLLSALQRLDQLLEQAVTQARVIYGVQAQEDPYRGLHINRDQVEQLLSRQPGAPLFTANDQKLKPYSTESINHYSRLHWLQQTFGLSTFAVGSIIIALAPEIDLRYERIYAYLQDDVTRKRPTVDLTLNLLCSSLEAKFRQRIHFKPDAPLIQQGLLSLIPDPHQVQPPLLSHYLKLDDHIISFLLGQEGLNPRLESFCQVIAQGTTVELDELLLRTQSKQALLKLVIQARNNSQSLFLHFSGQGSSLKFQLAQALASAIEMQLLVADLARISDSEEKCQHQLMLLFREAQFLNALLYFDNLDNLLSQAQTRCYQRLFEQLTKYTGIVILSSTKPELPSAIALKNLINLPFALPDFVQRRHYWQLNLASQGITIDQHELDALANRFCLNCDHITNAVITACNQALWTAAVEESEAFPPTKVQPTLNQLLAAARIQSDHNLGHLARKIKPKSTWDDLILPPDQFTQLKEICAQVKYRHIVYQQWGFDSKLSFGKGLNALFSGPPGTGKTMAAEVIASELQLDLYKIELSQIVSKYIGETEKNLDQIFAAAQMANTILFFDEADALFGKRSEVRDAHDRYANIEIGYLLQKMEEYEGISILTTNLRHNLDEAFVRRLAFTIHFPFPDEASRGQIWEKIWPMQVPLAEDVDVDFLARQFKLSGGNIKNIALAAAFLAAKEGSYVTMTHLLQGIRREYQKMGKILSETDLEGSWRAWKLKK
ncbi:MAG: ATP-binding protein [Symploca sp. SIO3C6]|uniref:ATP-binding protein n=1 Tax=Symploca sp. SIO1C4 TaxID=2607765 RepID=A0A6B3NF76_9CYAN|nr:ATP-binding protein [Symploca sp. SIO3C6]NER29595.1 ATP-binding protein [Symploca sp. SIO1C4]NET04227.1 ATP-binding protein [Symploca sp. SIO2B6]